MSKPLNAAAVAELLEQLAGRTPISLYRTALKTCILPAVKALPPAQALDAGFFVDKPAPGFEHLDRFGKVDWLGVVIDANEGIMSCDGEDPLTRQVKEW